MKTSTEPQQLRTLARTNRSDMRRSCAVYEAPRDNDDLTPRSSVRSSQGIEDCALLPFFPLRVLSCLPTFCQLVGVDTLAPVAFICVNALESQAAELSELATLSRTRM